MVPQRGPRAAIRVALADDNADMREMLRFALERSGDIEVVAQAADGDEALRAAVEHRPDILLIDLSMPGMEGLAPIAEVRRTVPGCRVIVLSGLDQPRLRELVLREGAAEYLVKGVLPREIVQAVRRHAAGDGM